MRKLIFLLAILTLALAACAPPYPVTEEPQPDSCPITLNFFLAVGEQTYDLGTSVTGTATFEKDAWPSGWYFTGGLPLDTIHTEIDQANANLDTEFGEGFINFYFYDDFVYHAMSGGPDACSDDGVNGQSHIHLYNNYDIKDDGRIFITNRVDGGSITFLIPADKIFAVAMESKHYPTHPIGRAEISADEVNLYLTNSIMADNIVATFAIENDAASLAGTIQVITNISRLYNGTLTLATYASGDTVYGFLSIQ